MVLLVHVLYYYIRNWAVHCTWRASMVRMRTDLGARPDGTAPRRASRPRGCGIKTDHVTSILFLSCQLCIFGRIAAWPLLVPEFSRDKRWRLWRRADWCRAWWRCPETNQKLSNNQMEVLPAPFLLACLQICTHVAAESLLHTSLAKWRTLRV